MMDRMEYLEKVEESASWYVEVCECGDWLGNAGRYGGEEYNDIAWQAYDVLRDTLDNEYAEKILDDYFAEKEKAIREKIPGKSDT